MRLGQVSESLVVDEMKRRGYEIVERNHRRKCGEIDFIARNNNEIVIVEVRSRRQDPGEEAVDSIRWKKKSAIRRTTERYLAKRPVDYDEVRFFVATVNWTGGGPAIEIIEDAF